LSEKSDEEVTEPFTKFLITRHGDIRKRFGPKEKLEKDMELIEFCIGKKPK
jgi:glutathione peroxidase-family protein